jgi:hypothetical protein
MSRKYPYSNGSEARAHWARINSRRFEMWRASSPENVAKANDMTLRSMGWTQERIDMARSVRSTKNNASTASSSAMPMQPESTISVTRTVSGAVKAGIIFGGAVSVTKNLHQVVSGGKEFHMAAKDVAIDVAIAGTSSAAIAATAEGIKFAAKATLPNVAKSFVKGSAPVVIASGLIELGVDAYKGELTAKTATVTVARTAGGWAGAEAGAVGGAALGAFFAPVTAGVSIAVCAFIGGIAGGIGGSFGAGKLAELAVS